MAGRIGRTCGVNLCLPLAVVSPSSLRTGLLQPAVILERGRVALPIPSGVREHANPNRAAWAFWQTANRLSGAISLPSPPARGADVPSSLRKCRRQASTVPALLKTRCRRWTQASTVGWLRSRSHYPSACAGKSSGSGADYPPSIDRRATIASLDDPQLSRFLPAPPVNRRDFEHEGVTTSGRQIRCSLLTYSRTGRLGVIDLGTLVRLRCAGGCHRIGPWRTAVRS